MTNEKAGSGEHHDNKEVSVEIDNLTKKLERGEYVVTQLKERLGVSPEKDLDQVLGGNLVTLKDGDHVSIRGGEVFFSHVRRGGSS